MTRLGTRAIVPVITAALLSWHDPPSEAAADPELEGADRTPAEVDAFLEQYYPAPVEGPELRLPVSPTRLYVDASYAHVDDLSSLPYITGTAPDVRFAAGGSWRWRRLAFTGELPFLNVTIVETATLMNQPPPARDARQTSVSVGDLRAGVDWTDHLSDAIVGGLGLRVRLPTHTARFEFHLPDGPAYYALPYYFHLEPTAILGAAVGRFAFVVNEGALVLIGPDGDFEGFHIHVPTLAFWDAAYAVSWAPLDVLAASLALSTDIQLNHVGGLDYTSFNGLRSVWLAPALQLHVAGYRVDLIARFGLSNAANLLGILEYAGTKSYTLRVSRSF
jgi:hypothetical protein